MRPDWLVFCDYGFSVCPLIPSCNTYRLRWVSLTLVVGYLLMAAPAKCCCCSLPWTRGISSGVPLLTLNVVKKNVLFIIGDWNAKAGSQETPRVTGKFGLGVWNEAGQRLIEFCQENAWVVRNTLFQQHKRRLYTWTSPDGQWRRKWQPTPVFLPGESQGRGEPDGLPSMGSHRVRHD